MSARVPRQSGTHHRYKAQLLCDLGERIDLSIGALNVAGFEQSNDSQPARQHLQFHIARPLSQPCRPSSTTQAQIDVRWTGEGVTGRPAYP